MAVATSTFFNILQHARFRFLQVGRCRRYRPLENGQAGGNVYICQQGNSPYEEENMGIGITPTALVERFAQDGISISERELRRRARELGCCHQIGNAMFFTPDDIDRLIAGLATPPSAPLGSAPAPEILKGAGLAEALALHERLMREQAEKTREEKVQGRRPRGGGD